LTPEQERWAEALMVERQHGATASEFVAERVSALARVGDRAGVARWLEIASHLDALSIAAQRQ
jgi:hypothetical protein